MKVYFQTVLLMQYRGSFTAKQIKKHSQTPCGLYFFLSNFLNIFVVICGYVCYNESRR